MRKELRQQLRRQRARKSSRTRQPFWLHWSVIQVPLTRGQRRKSDELMRFAMDKLYAELASNPVMYPAPRLFYVGSAEGQTIQGAMTPEELARW